MLTTKVHRTMATLATLLTLISIFSNVTFAKSTRTTRTIFIVQSDRDRQTLERDAELIYSRILSGSNGDSIHAFTTDAEPILTLDIPKKQNRLQAKKRVRLAAGELKTYFQKRFENPVTESVSIDIATAIAHATDRFNAKSTDHAVLVLLTDGLQVDSSFSWKSGFPTDSWIADPNSPFASIRSSQTPLKVVMVATQSSYVDAYHASMIQRWYQLFFQHRNGKLLLFTYDHRAATELLRTGLEKAKPPKSIEDAVLDAPLGFTKVVPIQQ